MDKMLSRRQVCYKLGVSMTTLCRLMKSGKIPYYKTSSYKSGKVLFKESDVDKVLESFKVK